MNNPYLDKFIEVGGEDRFSFSNLNSSLSRYESRGQLVVEYAWSVPTKEAVELIKKYSPIVEVGAGTGYWAKLIHEAGGKIDCYDENPPILGDNPYSHKKQHYPILPVQFLKWNKTSNKTLFLSWPPYDDDMAIDCLLKYQGDTLIYIGESEYGCTANHKFFRELEKRWIEIEGCSLPQWDGIHDHLTVYRSK